MGFEDGEGWLVEALATAALGFGFAGELAATNLIHVEAAWARDPAPHGRGPSLIDGDWYIG